MNNPCFSAVMEYRSLDPALDHIFRYVFTTRKSLTDWMHAIADDKDISHFTLTVDYGTVVVDEND